MDFSKVTSLQIPEGNVTKIEDKEGNILWTNDNIYNNDNDTIRD